MPPESTNYTYRFGEKVAIDNVDFLNDELEPRFTSAKIQSIIYDLENVHVCDLYGIRFFLHSQRSAEQNKKQLVLYRASPLLKDILRDAGLFRIFTFTDSLEKFFLD
jgi:anti-anti-sigma factor